MISCIDNSVKLYVAPYDEDKGDCVLQYIMPMQQVFFELKEKNKSKRIFVRRIRDFWKHTIAAGDLQIKKNGE